MDATPEQVNNEQDLKNKEDDGIDRALLQMESIYKSRCIRPPGGSNITIREVKKDE